MVRVNPVRVRGADYCGPRGRVARGRGRAFASQTRSAIVKRTPKSRPGAGRQSRHRMNSVFAGLPRICDAGVQKDVRKDPAGDMVHSTVAELFDLAIERRFANLELLGGMTAIAAYGAKH